MIIIAIAISRFADHHHFCATNNCGRSHYSIRFLFLLLLHSKLLCSVFFLCLSSLLFINCGIIMIFHWNETKWNETKRDKKKLNNKQWKELKWNCAKISMVFIWLLRYWQWARVNRIEWEKKKERERNGIVRISGEDSFAAECDRMGKQHMRLRKKE